MGQILKKRAQAGYTCGDNFMELATGPRQAGTLGDAIDNSASEMLNHLIVRCTNDPLPPPWPAGPPSNSTRYGVDAASATIPEVQTTAASRCFLLNSRTVNHSARKIAKTKVT